MKTIEITADWILENFHHTGCFPGDGTATIYCDEFDMKWNVLALNDVLYTYSENSENEIGEFEAEFYFQLKDIAEIAPIFYKKGMQINNSNKKFLKRNKWQKKPAPTQSAK